MLTKKFYLKLLMSLLLVALAVPQSKAEPLIVANGTDTHKAVPFYGYYTDQLGMYAQMIYPAAELSAMTGKEITAITFVSSTGIQFSGCTFTVTIGTTTNTVFTSTSRLSITDGKSGTITPDKNATDLTVTFDEPFVYNGGNIIIETLVTTKTSMSGADATDGATLFYGKSQSTNTAINSKGGSYGTAGYAQFLPKVTFTYEGGAPKPEISATPASLNFSTVTVTGSNLTEGITASISGTNASYFTVSPASLGTTGGELTVTYNPTAAGEHTATLTLSSAGANPVEIALNGTATPPAQPYAVTVNPENGYDFGNVLVNNTKVWTIKVTNNGTESVTPTLSGIEAPFSTNYTAAALAAGQSR